MNYYLGVSEIIGVVVNEDICLILFIYLFIYLFICLFIYVFTTEVVLGEDTEFGFLAIS